MREGWKQIKLGDIIHIKHGYGFKGEYFVEEPNDNILVTPGNFAIGGGFKNGKMKYYDGPINNEFVLSEGDVIVTMTDLSKQADTLGYSAKVPKDDKNTYLHNQRIGLVSLLTNDFDIDFIYWLLRTHSYQRYIAGSSSGATVKHTSPKKIYSTKLTVPKSKKNQRKIASILSAYDDLIENNLKRIKLLEEQAQQTYEEWFVRFKFPGHENVKFDEVSGLPVGWEISTLGEFAKTSSGGTPSRKKESDYYENGTIPWVKTGELKNFMLIDSKEKITKLGLEKSSAKLFPKKTVLLAMYGNTIGETTFLTFEASTNQACCGFLVKDELYKSYFLHQFLLNQKEYILNFRMGAAQENISQGIIQNIKFKKPSKAILLEFEKQIAPKYDLIEKLFHQNQLLKEARDILLPRLMSGMINVDGLEVEEQLGMVAEEKAKYNKV